MNILDRILLMLLALWAIFASVVVVVFCTGVASAWRITVWSQNFHDELYAVVIAILFTVIAVRFLVYRLGGPEADFVVLPGDHGHVRISFTTFQQLSNRTGHTIRGVESFDTRVRHGQSGIVLAVRVRVHPDVDINETSRQIQGAVKSHVEQVTSVVVERITVNVTEIAAGGAKSSKPWVD